MASDAKVSFSSKVEYHAVIRYFYLKGKTDQEIHCELTNVHGSSAPSYAQVNFLVGEFKHSRTSLEDETRSGRPSDATDEEMCNKVQDLVYSDKRIKVLFVCVEVLLPSQPNEVMSSVVSLPNHTFTGQA